MHCICMHTIQRNTYMHTCIHTNEMYTCIHTNEMHSTRVRHASTSYVTCNALQHTATHSATHCNTLQHTATHTATHCNTLQHTATHSATHCNTLQHTATHIVRCVSVSYITCSTLQHTATHCNTVQHAATQLSQCVSTSPDNSNKTGFRFKRMLFIHSLTILHRNTLQHTVSRTYFLSRSDWARSSHQTHIINHLISLHLCPCVGGKILTIASSETPSPVSESPPPSSTLPPPPIRCLSRSCCA